jgi:hypothetical protein
MSAVHYLCSISAFCIMVTKSLGNCIIVKNWRSVASIMVRASLSTSKLSVAHKMRSK